jgi:hypothetical protein
MLAMMRRSLKRISIVVDASLESLECGLARRLQWQTILLVG